MPIRQAIPASPIAMKIASRPSERTTALRKWEYMTTLPLVDLSGCTTETMRSSSRSLTTKSSQRPCVKTRTRPSYATSASDPDKPFLNSVTTGVSWLKSHSEPPTNPNVRPPSVTHLTDHTPVSIVLLFSCDGVGFSSFRFQTHAPLVPPAKPKERPSRSSTPATD